MRQGSRAVQELASADPVHVYSMDCIVDGAGLGSSGGCFLCARYRVNLLGGPDRLSQQWTSSVLSALCLFRMFGPMPMQNTQQHL
jgi:hypothetical protein